MRIIGITILLLFMGIYSQAQQTNFNNDFNRDENRTLGLHTSSKFLGNTNSTCNGQNTFWGMEQGLAYAKEFELTGNTISYTGNLIPMCSGCGALAICNNLNGGSPSLLFIQESALILIIGMAILPGYKTMLPLSQGVIVMQEEMIAICIFMIKITLVQ
ncbi:MAG: hypothetical protein IPN13_12225 [Bacteroidetes bacterium]|nr:hypothetical protein [Bacteroidota bacterium]